LKQFKFSLETVHGYKQQLLDAARNEYAEVLARVAEQEKILDAVWERYRSYNSEFCERKAVGLPLQEAVLYESGLRVLEIRIQEETEALEKLRVEEDQKREQVLEARKETATLEKLRDKKYAAYQKAVQKSEEAFIDELVCTARAGSAV